MAEGRRTSERAQAMGGYAILLGAIAVGCAFVLLFVGKGINNLWEGDAEKIPSRGPFRPPGPTATIPMPTTLEECANDGWRTYSFTSQEACEVYVREMTK